MGTDAALSAPTNRLEINIEIERLSQGRGLFGGAFVFLTNNGPTRRQEGEEVAQLVSESFRT